MVNSQPNRRFLFQNLSPRALRAPFPFGFCIFIANEHEQHSEEIPMKIKSQYQFSSLRSYELLFSYFPLLSEHKDINKHKHKYVHYE